MDVSEFHPCSYICKVCQTKRTVNIDGGLHLQREELMRTGLASYIDVHRDVNHSEKEEHGMKLYIDINFKVRANDQISLKLQPIRSNLPIPTLKRQQHHVTAHFSTWNTLLLTSKTHNLDFSAVDSQQSNEGGTQLDILSPHQSISLSLNISKHVTEEFILNLMGWFKNLIKWIELTAELNTAFLLPLLHYIDSNNIRPSTVTDELVLSVLLDKTAKIQLLEPPKNKSNILKNSAITFPDFNEEEAFISSTGIDMPGLQKISDILIDGEEHHIINLLKICTTSVEVNTLVQIIIDLLRINKIIYHVSYLQ